jgi:hypothetical protein
MSLKTDEHDFAHQLGSLHLIMMINGSIPMIFTLITKEPSM